MTNRVPSIRAPTAAARRQHHRRGGRVELLNGSAILSVAYANGPGGSIAVTADDIVISGVHPDIYKDSTKHLAIAASTISTQSYMVGGRPGTSA